MNNSRRYTLLALLFAAIVAMFPNSVLFPASADLAMHLGRSEAIVGWMVTTYAIAYILATPPLGVLSDYLGRRAVLVSGLAVFAVGGTVPLWDTHVVPVLLGRVVMGVGSAGIMPMVDSLIGDAYAQGPERRRALAGFGASVAVAEAVVPFLGGVAATWHWQAVFGLYLISVPAAVACLLMSVPARTTAAVARVSLSDYRQSVKLALKVPQLYAAMVGAVLYGLVYFGVCSLLPFTTGNALSGVVSGSLFLPIGGTWVLFTALLANRPHLVRLRLLLVSSAVGLAGLTAWLGYAVHLILVLLIGLGWGIGSAVLCTVFTWMIGDESPDMVRGAMNGLYNAAYILGFSIGAPIFLWLRVKIGLAPSLWCAVGLLLVLAGFLTVSLRDRGNGDGAVRQQRKLADRLATPNPFGWEMQ